MDIPQLKPRKAESHKATFGRACIIGGSRGMTGSVCLAGAAALRAGAGLVSVAVPDRCLDVVASYDPNYMTIPVPDDSAGRFAVEAVSTLAEMLLNATSVGIGPGMAQSADVTKIVAGIYDRFAGPMVVDADALNAMAHDPDRLNTAAGPRILTPHIGEFRRLIGDSQATPSECREQVNEFAAANSVIVVLKGNRTIVTDGTKTYVNCTGNPGMATGGSGDVLTGVITGLLGQALSPLEAAILGVYAHGIAGDVARDQFGELSMVAENIKDSLPAAFQSIA